MLKKLFEFLCLVNGVSAGGDFTETKWKRNQRQRTQPPATDAARPTAAADRNPPGRDAPPRGTMKP